MKLNVHFSIKNTALLLKNCPLNNFSPVTSEFNLRNLLSYCICILAVPLLMFYFIFLKYKFCLNKICRKLRECLRSWPCIKALHNKQYFENTILRRIYDKCPYQVSHALLQWFIPIAIKQDAKDIFYARPKYLLFYILHAKQNCSIRTPHFRRPIRAP